VPCLQYFVTLAGLAYLIITLEVLALANKGAFNAFSLPESLLPLFLLCFLLGGTG